MTYPKQGARMWEELQDLARADVSNENWGYVRHTYHPGDNLPYTFEFAAGIACMWRDSVENIRYTFRFHVHCLKINGQIEWTFGGLWSDGLTGESVAGNELHQYSDTDYKKFAELASGLINKYYDEKIG